MKNSKTPEMEKRDLTALNPEDIEKVSGGYVYNNTDHPDYTWEAISNRDGSVIGRYRTKEEAAIAATSSGNSTDKIWRAGTLEKIRNDSDRDKIKLD